MSGVRVNIGDIFCAPLESEKKYFQYIVRDHSQLNSHVIRVFKKSYSTNEKPDLDKIVEGNIDFYAHVFLRAGFTLRLWEKVGNAREVGKWDVLFRRTDDILYPKIKISEKWYVWKINEPHVWAGKLEGENQNAEIGMVMSPINILHRMRTGKYKSHFPS
jgi:hypothetical protein